ncbi:MAG TPA: hypothetical protein VK815_13190 [Candidatus Acidoferrales bacterium]|jgi:hypothetical protein|nr:hypothetical protein [Candidatus Acidoferrales bacterium]
MKKWSIGELQALRAAWRFMFGLGAFTIIISVFLLILSLNLTPEQKDSDVHKHDARDGAFILVAAMGLVIAGWKLRSYVRKCEEQTGQSSKPFGWMP